MRSTSAITTSSETSISRLLGGEAMVVEQPLDLRRQAEVEQVGRAEVDATLRSWPPLAQPADLLERAVEHERGQRARQPALLDQREEVAGAEQAALRMVPAHERLDAAHDAGAQVGLRLVVQDELAGLQRGAAARRRARAAGGCGGRDRRGRPRGRCACAWPGTSRRRRAAAGPWRRSSARGRARCRRSRRCGRGCRRPRTDCSSAARSRSPAVLADASSPGWRITANSSPPSRASVSSSRSSS